MIIWYKIDCANCGVENWIDNGGPSDLMVRDELGFACWSCQHNMLVNCEGKVRATEEEQLVNGLRAPTDERHRHLARCQRVIAEAQRDAANAIKAIQYSKDEEAEIGSRFVLSVIDALARATAALADASSVEE